MKRSMPSGKAEIQDLSEGRIGALFDVGQCPRNPAGLHSHPHYEMLYMIKGVRELELNGVHWKAKPGDLIVFKPGEEHVEYMGTSKVSYFFLRFKQEELAGSRLALPEALESATIVPLPSQGQFIDIFNRMLDEQSSSTPDSLTLMRAYLVEFVVKLRRAIAETAGEFGGGVPVEERILGAMERIERSAGGALDFERIARDAFMSPSHFSHSFKSRFGESPKSYQIGRRIKMAKELLRDSSMPAMEVARQLGYKDPYFFYRQFKRKTGMTPAEFRNDLAAKG